MLKHGPYASIDLPCVHCFQNHWRLTLRKAGIFIFAMAGASFVILAGSALHFAFEWSGNWLPLALFAAVNESTWEHLKIAYWPGVAWGVWTMFILQLHWRRVFVVEALALALTAVLIVVIFETYTHMLGRNVLVLDIATFAVSITIGRFFSASLIAREFLSRGIKWFGGVLGLVQLAAYSTLTFYPPPFRLFVDPVTGHTGVIL